MCSFFLYGFVHLCPRANDKHEILLIQKSHNSCCKETTKVAKLNTLAAIRMYMPNTSATSPYKPGHIIPTTGERKDKEEV